MFENSGKKIMGYVKFIFYFNVGLTSFLIMFAWIFSMTTLRMDFGESLLVLLVSSAIGAINVGLTYIGLLFLNAFGELVRNSATQTKLLRAMAGLPDTDSDKRVCPKCGTVQPAGTSFCHICGTPLR